MNTSKKITIIFCILLAVALFLYVFLSSGADSEEPPVTPDISIQDEPEVFVNQNLVDFSSTHEDAVGWITIEGTNIDYPVVQGEDNQFYLKHDVDKNSDKNGSIYLDYREKKGYGDHNILYGHNMKNGKMFRQVVEYKDQEFFEAHQIIQYDTLDKIEEWEVFSVYVVNADYETLHPYFLSDEEFLEFLASVSERSLFQKEMEFTKDDSILTLCTCSYETDNSRTIVHAKRINSIDADNQGQIEDDNQNGEGEYDAAA